ncbi:acyl-CoA synthetase (AMP-forming)/AMP-acid ligase II (macronuclear) [Tetrahymena thermophila SB210]|uniref:Acyl-CoA synthetase (AMP-forming)/AMP-acid ligase II n=1 Tax=Tetrahymena thermophila (strain SB210) TaxID=312017 RepID=I7MJV9_TETTS|nr:acyl-CoA synthetase (AMP-forming)/AMP-acid ligase II [Tetrahymena thermophila SB210]EAR97244.2 acyl-CoA synthetase (AMP-forming)/AMP-acid ligase II [Tetrahymena thermophila SB210]|eukprot:XP_001017489.2 acyl-CoA synthetase (AMP-forming)/AMP-acid ligase II [Tetrahymena thermophila SB210]
MSNQFLPKLDDNEYLYCSPEGFQRLASVYDPKDPYKNYNWTLDYTLELPIRVKKSGPGSEQPFTLVEMFERIVKQIPDSPALSVKKNGKWVTLTYKQYFEESKVFGKALISLGMTPYRSVNIIGFNSPEWVISFYGSIFGYYLPVGVYTTNGPEACQYVAENSDCEVVIVENQTHLDKYLKVLDKLPLLKYIVVYNDTIKNVPENCRVKVFTWDQFMSHGRSFKPENPADILENRMIKQRPGNCCTLVYTSGTTGMPKGVMLSHDNYTWTCKACIGKYGLAPNQQERLVSYLPLSHVAAQIIDIVGNIEGGAHMFFADPSALSGSLVETLKEVRPTFFFSVPRVWEKIEEKMKALAASNGWLKTKIATWAKGMGVEGTFAEVHNKKLPFGFGLAKKVVYNNVKKALGLDQSRFLMYGAAPLSPAIREYFLSLNMYLISGYGMSECAGPECLSDPSNYDKFEGDFFNSTGAGISGTDLVIYQPDKEGNGEICYKGRNRFMGYFKNEDATRQTIDSQGFLHSGDVGKLDKFGNLTITGRIKELIITAGGENVAPVLIENILKENLNFVSNAVVIGDKRKYLVVLLTFKFVQEGDKLSNQLSPESLREFEALGSTAKTVAEAKKDPKILQAIEQAIKKTNSKAISRAQNIQKYAILDSDFSIDGGDLTPTLKLKRNVVNQKHEALIESLYVDPKL